MRELTIQVSPGFDLGLSEKVAGSITLRRQVEVIDDRILSVKGREPTLRSTQVLRGSDVKELKITS